MIIEFFLTTCWYQEKTDRRLGTPTPTPNAAKKKWSSYRKIHDDGVHVEHPLAMIEYQKLFLGHLLAKYASILWTRTSIDRSHVLLGLLRLQFCSMCFSVQSNYPQIHYSINNLIIAELIYANKVHPTNYERGPRLKFLKIALLCSMGWLFVAPIYYYSVAIWDTDLDQNWLRYWLVAWRHQAITWSNNDFSRVRFCGIHSRKNALWVAKVLFCIVNFKIKLWQLLPRLSGVSGLNLLISLS